MTAKKLLRIDESSLPKSWKGATLADVTEYIQRGKGPKYIERSNLPVINQKCIRWFGIQKEHLKYVDPGQWSAWGEERYVRVGDVLWNSTGTGTIGRAALVRNLAPGEKYVVDSHVTIVRPKDIDPLYVHYWIMSPSVQGSIEAMQSGSTNQVELSKSAVEALPIPVAPPDQQKSIVAEIEKQFSRLDEAVATLKRVKANLKRYKAAVLKAAVEGRFGLNDAGSWTRANLGTVLAAIEAGKSFKCEERMPNNDEIGVVKVSAVTWGKYNEEESKTCLDADRIEPRYFVRPGDFLFSRANTIELVGACVIAQKVTRRIMLSDKILRFRFCDDVLPQWALYWLRSDIGRKEIQRLSTGNQESMRNIGQDRIRQITFALPNLDEQQQIVAEVERRLSVIEELETTVEVNLIRADRLRKSVLQQAFSGQLVSQTPNTGSVSAVPVRPERMQIEPTIMSRQNEASFQEVTSTMANLIETLASVRDWISAQEAFRLCGIGSGTGTDAIEQIYEELRGHIDSGRIVINRRGESDWLCLSEHRGA